MPADAIPRQARAYLADPALAGLWQQAAHRLERNGLRAAGTLAVSLDPDAAQMVGGILGRTLKPGRTRISLPDLDTALRGSTADAGLLAVVQEVTGRTLQDRPAQRQQQRQVRDSRSRTLQEGLAAAGLAAAPWAADYLADVRRTGLLTRAGTASADELRTAAAALAVLAPALRGGPAAAGQPIDLAALATEVAGDAHALDPGRTAAALVLRAAAAANQHPAPRTSAERRQLWELLGVRPDAVSGTVLALGLRPPGGDDWSQMMRLRADLHLPTHLTIFELDRTAGPVAGPGTTVSVVENPQVLQAAAHARLDAPLLCLAGNPSSVGQLLLARLNREGAALRYHGDFDWPGITIAATAIRLGAKPWRMTAADYLDAVQAVTAPALPELQGDAAETPWDPDLAAAMRARGVAVHEELLMQLLLQDLAGPE